MTAPNGRANGSAIENSSELLPQTLVPPAVMSTATAPRLSGDHIKEFVRELEVPFDPEVIESG